MSAPQLFVSQRHASSALQRGAVYAALFIATWFCLSSTFTLMLAAFTGKTIEIVVCSGAGIKKVSVPAQEGSDRVSTVKHCANAPLLACLALPGDPVHLQFEAPRTVASWSWIPEPLAAWDRLRESHPPQGRAPPFVAQV